MSSTISGWTILTVPSAEPRAHDAAGIDNVRWRSSWRRAVTSLWNEAAQEQIIREIETLRDDWDGAGAYGIGESAAKNARDILVALNESGYTPDSIVPNPAATIEFEWERAYGSARLEIGNSTFSFYTVPHAGNSIMKDGWIDGAFDVDEICFALATIESNDFARSLVDWDKPVGFASRHTLCAA